MNILRNPGNTRPRPHTGARTGLLAAACLLAAVAMAVPEDAFARGGRGGGGRGGGGMARSSVSGASRASMGTGARAGAGDRVNSGNFDRNNVGNRVNTGDINIDRGDINIDVDPDYGVRRYPIATLAAGAAIGATIAYGTMYSAIPAGCPIVDTYVVPYYYCGGVYYEQQMEGDDIVYMVVTP